MKMQSVSSHSTFLVLGFPEALCAGTPAIWYIQIEFHLKNGATVQY